MSIYLNTNKPLINYMNLYRSKYFVDKSSMIEKLNEVIETSDKYICITRPRRFGKSSVIDMLGSYYSIAVDSKDVFDNLKISSFPSYTEHLNKYNVINISFNDLSDQGIADTSRAKSVASVSFSNDNKRLMMVGKDGVVIIRNLHLDDYAEQ